MNATIRPRAEMLKMSDGIKWIDSKTEFEVDDLIPDLLKEEQILIVQKKTGFRCYVEVTHQGYSPNHGGQTLHFRLYAIRDGDGHPMKPQRTVQNAFVNLLSHAEQDDLSPVGSPTPL